jgi:acyl-CoA thioesterase-2
MSLLPHPGMGQSRAHHDFSTGVITHTLTFHEPFRSGDWVLLALEVPHAGGGRAYGRAEVFNRNGALVASFVQDAMVRHFPGGAPATGHAGAL